MINKNKKIIFLEPEMEGGMGHHMDNLIESSIFFSKKFEIFWITNKDFKSDSLFIPEFVCNFKIINNFKKKNISQNCYKFLFDLVLNFIFIIKKIKEKKFLIFFKVFKENYFTFPEYFCSFNKLFHKIDFTENDVIIVQRCRPKDLELIHFILKLYEKSPRVILRVLFPPKKKKLKNFFYFYKKLKSDETTKNKIRIYTEVSSVKKTIEDELHCKIDNFTQIYTFFNRKKNNELITGFLGESRIDKGFDKLPDLISQLSHKKNDTKFIIQFSKKIYKETELYKKKIIEQELTNNNINLYKGYLDYDFYRNLLKKITIMPILYTVDQVNNLGSGLFFSCITHEIPMVIPKGAEQLKQYLKVNNFLEASSTDEYVEKIIEIHNNYDYFLNESKKLSRIYYENIKKDKLVNDVLNN